MCESQPEVLAQHYAHAGERARAARYWQKAGAKLIATEGYGADEVELAYQRARDLLPESDRASVFRAELGLEACFFMRADFDRAQRLLESARAAVAPSEESRTSDDQVRELQLRWAECNLQFHLGELQECLDRAEECLSLYKHEVHHRPRAVQDPGIMSYCYSSWALWQLGYPDKAIERIEEGRTLAVSELKHPFSIWESYCFEAAIRHFRGENDMALESAEQAIEICARHGFAIWLAYARLLRGRVRAEQARESGVVGGALMEMKAAYEMWHGTGAVVTIPYCLALQGEPLAWSGDPSEGRRTVQQALDVIGIYGERYYEAEVKRLLGVLTLEEGADRCEEKAELCFRDAKAFALEKGHKSMELRATISLATLLSSRGDHTAASDLSVVYNWFTEGHATSDLTRAAELNATINA